MGLARRQDKWRVLNFVVIILTLIYAFIVFQTISFSKRSSITVAEYSGYDYVCPKEWWWFPSKIVHKYLYQSCKPLNLSEVGDYLSGSLSFIALIWAALGFGWQAREFALQREEYEEGNKILQSQRDEYSARYEREIKWQEQSFRNQEIIFSREKKDRISRIARYIHARYEDLNQRPPESEGAAMHMLSKCVEKIEVIFDASDQDSVKTMDDLDEVRTILNYLAKYDDKNPISSSIPISKKQLQSYKDLIVKIDRLD